MPATILFFHGLGGNAQSMIPFSDYCETKLAEARTLRIEGRLLLQDGKTPSLGWFTPAKNDLRFVEGPQAAKFNHLPDAVSYVHQEIYRLLENQVDPDDIHLIGHSQGGAVAIASGLTFPKKLGSVSTVAGYVALTPELKTLSTGTPYFLHHSNYDDNVNVCWAKYAEAYIKKLGEPCEVTFWEIKQDPHWMHWAQLDAICELIGNPTR